MVGEPEQTWDPWQYLHERHPEVRVIRTRELQPPLQGCVDFPRRLIFVAEYLTSVEVRCTLAYEIAEYEQGPTPRDPCLARSRQQAATELAARRLIVGCDLMRVFASAPTIPEAAALLGVDGPTLRARLRGLTDDEQDAVMRAIEQRWVPA